MSAPYMGGLAAIEDQKALSREASVCLVVVGGALASLSAIRLKSSPFKLRCSSKMHI